MTDLREQFEHRQRMNYSKFAWPEKYASGEYTDREHRLAWELVQWAYEAGRSSLALEMAEKVEGLQRYRPVLVAISERYQGGMTESSNGEYLKHADVEALLGGKNG